MKLPKDNPLRPYIGGVEGVKVLPLDDELEGLVETVTSRVFF